MNEYLAAVYRKDEHSLVTLLAERGYEEAAERDEALRMLLGNAEFSREERWRFAELLLGGGADPNSRAWDDQPLVAIAARQHDIKLVQTLVNYGANANAISDDDRTTLHLAAECGDADLGLTLLKAGADANARDADGHTPLMIALSHNYSDLVSILLPFSDVGVQNVNGLTALHMAALFSRLPQMSQLILSLADPDAHDMHGETPLMICADHGDLEGAELLIKAGCEVNRTNYSGNTALHIASHVATRSGMKLVSLLLRVGANMNIRNYRGNTPLFIAVESSSLPGVLCLIQHNCDVNVRGHSVVSGLGKVYSPLELACYYNNVVIMAMLLTAGCTFDRHLVECTLAHFAVVNLTVDDDSQSDTSSEGDESQTKDGSKSEDLFDTCVELVKAAIARPVCLRHLCRIAVRQSLGDSIMDKLPVLHLPPSLKDYISLQELHSLI